MNLILAQTSPATQLVPAAGFEEPMGTAVLLTVLGVLVGVSVLFSRAIDRLGVPIVLLFLVLGMLGGSEALGGIPFDDYRFAVRAGTAALVLILFDGGLNTSVASVRQVLLPAGLLATLGVALTAGLVALCARLVGLEWSAALLLGAVVSSTDAAAVFAVLRGGRLALVPRVARTLEVESCINDPMAVILTTTLIQVLESDQAVGPSVLMAVPIQLAVGAGVGLMVGYLSRLLLRRVRLRTVGLYPALTLAIAFISFGLATITLGSGFLAVYATAVVLGNAPLPYRSGLTRIHDALAWLSQIAMFLMLGLLVFPSQLPEIALEGMAIALFLALIARPVAIFLCLWPLRYPLLQILYIGWIGLRGAVPIILATFPVLAGLPQAGQLFNLVFFIVVISSLFPGSTIRPVTRWMKLDVPQRPVPPAVLEINSSHPFNAELTSFFIAPSVAVCGARLSDIEFPSGAAVVLIVRGHELLAARGDTRLESGDHVYVFFRPEDRPFIELIFGQPEEGATV